MRDQVEQLADVTDKKNKTRACPHAGTILAFDFGLKRIGTAIGNLELCLAHPLSTISNESRNTCFAAIAQLIEEWQPVLLVVGLPSYPDGSEHEPHPAKPAFCPATRKPLWYRNNTSG